MGDGNTRKHVHPLMQHSNWGTSVSVFHGSRHFHCQIKRQNIKTINK